MVFSPFVVKSVTSRSPLSPVVKLVKPKSAYLLTVLGPVDGDQVILPEYVLMFLSLRVLRKLSSLVKSSKESLDKSELE